MRYRLCVFLIAFCFGGAFHPCSAQTYFKWLESPARSHTRKVAALPNSHDRVIADASLAGLTMPDQRGIWVTRIDECGREVWAYRYRWSQNVLEFKDMAVSAAGELFILGSAFTPPSQEYFFLLKLSRNGQLLQYRMWNGQTIDHFVFSIQASEGQLLISGLLLDWWTFKQGFYAVFDEDLNFLTGKKVNVFTSDGKAVWTPDRGILLRSGPYVFQFDAQHQLEWSIEWSEVQGNYPLAGPFPAPSGHWFQMYRNGYSFFYEIDADGNSVRQSPAFPSADIGVECALQPDSTYAVLYVQPDGALARLHLHPDGHLSDFEALQVQADLSIQSIAQVDDGRYLTLLGNAAFTAEPSGFLLQWPKGVGSDSCAQWMAQAIDTLSESPLVAIPLTVSVSDFVPEIQQGTAIRIAESWEVSGFCGPDTLRLLQFDTLLACDAAWAVRLPEDMQWEDGTVGLNRVLQTPGVYTAINRDCARPLRHQYTVAGEVCPCPIYMPNVFTPDQSGLNDRYTAFSSCVFDHQTLRIYNRWGELVFSGTGADAAWDGGRVTPGVYVAVFTCDWVDESGQAQYRQLVKDLTVAR